MRYVGEVEQWEIFRGLRSVFRIFRVCQVDDVKDSRELA